MASYIPALAKSNPRTFGIAGTTMDGSRVQDGDAEEPFSIRSVSKVITLTLDRFTAKTESSIL